MAIGIPKSTIANKSLIISETGTPPLARLFGTQKNSVKGKPRCRRSILVLKQENRTFLLPKSSFWAKCSIEKVINSSNQITFKPKKCIFKSDLLHLQWKYNLIVGQRLFLSDFVFHIQRKKKFLRNFCSFLWKTMLDRILTRFLA